MSPVSHVSGRNRNRGAAVTLVLGLGFWTAFFALPHSEASTGCVLLTPAT